MADCEHGWRWGGLCPSCVREAVEVRIVELEARVETAERELAAAKARIYALECDKVQALQALDYAFSSHATELAKHGWANLRDRIQ